MQQDFPLSLVVVAVCVKRGGDACALVSAHREIEREKGDRQREIENSITEH